MGDQDSPEQNWEHYFHFPEGTTFFIDGSIVYDGVGKVLKKTDKILKIRMDMDKWRQGPAVHADITIEYKSEGFGNRVLYEEDKSDPIIDSNANIKSKDKKRKRSIDSKEISCSFKYKSEKEIVFSVVSEGKTHDFDFEKIG